MLALKKFKIEDEIRFKEGEYIYGYSPLFNKIFYGRCSFDGAINEVEEQWGEVIRIYRNYPHGSIGIPKKYAYSNVNELKRKLYFESGKTSVYTEIFTDCEGYIAGEYIFSNVLGKKSPAISKRIYKNRSQWSIFDELNRLTEGELNYLYFLQLDYYMNFDKVKPFIQLIENNCEASIGELYELGLSSRNIIMITYLQYKEKILRLSHLFNQDDANQILCELKDMLKYQYITDWKGELYKMVLTLMKWLRIEVKKEIDLQLSERLRFESLTLTIKDMYKGILRIRDLENKAYNSRCHDDGPFFIKDDLIEIYNYPLDEIIDLNRIGDCDIQILTFGKYYKNCIIEYFRDNSSKSKVRELYDFEDTGFFICRNRLLKYSHSYKRFNTVVLIDVVTEDYIEVTANEFIIDIDSLIRR